MLRATPEDTATTAPLRLTIDQGRRTVEQFFGAPFPEPFVVTVVPSRAAFSDVLRAEWGVPDTECWMVATGVADFVVILSPRVWEADACEHDAADAGHVRDLVTHELTHVYHGQANPTRDFTGADEVGWFAEGLAVHVAGQLRRNRLADPRAAVEQGAVPLHLADAWSGTYRYGISGSLVEYIDQRFGREVLRGLLAATTQERLLSLLGASEDDLLSSWKAWVLARP